MSVIEGALQRIEGWRGGRTPPLGGPLPPLGVARRSEDSEHAEPGRLWVSARPVGVSTPLGCSFDEPWHATSRSPAGPPCAFVPLQRHATAAPHRSVARPPVPKDRRATRPAMLPLLGFRALRHSLGPVDPLAWRQIPLPPRATCEVWLPPSRPPPPGPTGARSAGASLGFALQGLPLVAMGAPLGVPALLTLPPASPPEGERNRSGRLQGLVPATSPFRRHPPPEGRERPPIPSWAFPLQSVLLNRPGDRF
jgi:hypothetical protein